MNKQKDDNASFAIGMGAIVAVAVYSQKESQIKHWLYENMMMLVLAAFVILALLVYRGIQKMKKRQEEVLKRIKAVNSVKAQNEQQYYRRRR